MKTKIEVSKNSDGRVEAGKILFGERKGLQFNNEWDDDGFLRSIIFDGSRKDLPSAVELYWLMNEKFIEQIRKIDLIKEIENIQKIDEVHIANATVQNILQGFNFTERWENGFFDRRKYYGRTGPYFQNEAEEPPPYTVPTMVKGINTAQPFPWNNMIHMVNSKDGVTQTEIYFGIPLAFNRAVLRIDAILPTVAQIGDPDDLVAWGFETCSQGGTTAIYVQGVNGGYLLCANYQGPTGGGIYSSIVINPIHTNQCSSYWLEFNFPIVRLFEFFGGAWLLLGELPLTEPSNGDFYVCPFFCNESATNIVSNFYIGNISVWALGGKPLPAHVDSAVNLAVDAYIETMGARELVLKMGVDSGNMIGNTYIFVSLDNVNWDNVESLANPAAVHFYKTYDDNHLAAGANHVTNVPIWPFVRVNLDAQGAGKTGRIEWALK